MNRQVDVCRNPSPRTRARIPFLLMLQSERFDSTRGVVVAPLALAHDRPAEARLYPNVQVEDRTLAVIVTEIATVPRELVRDPVANLRSHRDDIIRTLDLRFTGV